MTSEVAFEATGPGISAKGSLRTGGGLEWTPVPLCWLGLEYSALCCLGAWPS